MKPACPHCGGTVEVALVAPVEAPRPALPIPEAWLEPGLIAYRLGIGEAYVRKLCGQALRLDLPGVRKVGGRWQATVEAIDSLRRV